MEQLNLHMIVRRVERPVLMVPSVEELKNLWAGCESDSEKVLES